MKKLLMISLLVTSLLAGCGSSSGGPSVPTAEFDFDQASGNFITSSVEVESQFLYILNRGDNNVSGFLLPRGAGEGGHVHGRILAQEEEEEGFEVEQLDGSPFLFGSDALIDMVVDPDGQFLVLLDTTGRLRSYRIDGFRGFLFLESEVQTNVRNPRRLVAGVDRLSVGVLGDDLSVHELGEDGAFSAGSFLANTQSWVDVDLQNRNGVTSTQSGMSGFQWSPGNPVTVRTDLTLPGGTRGEIVIASLGVYVVNSADQSLSFLEQAANGEVTLNTTFPLPANLTNPQLISDVFEGEDLLISDADTLVLIHPEPTEIEDEGSVSLNRVPSRLFPIPESSTILIGHNIGSGTTVVTLDEDEQLEVMPDTGPGAASSLGFGYAERDETITETSSL